MVQIDENYNDETTLDEYYPKIKNNIARLAQQANTNETAAAVAQETADAAVSGAAKAQKTADTAVSDASKAQEMADAASAAIATEVSEREAADNILQSSIDELGYTKLDCFNFGQYNVSDGTVENTSVDVGTGELVSGSFVAFSVSDTCSSISLPVYVGGGVHKSYIDINYPMDKGINYLAVVTTKPTIQSTGSSGPKTAYEAVNGAARVICKNGLFEIPIASATTIGGIKLYHQGATNRSGLVINDDGTAYINVNANYGLTRSGDGKVTVAAASTAEVTAGTHEYKPVTPKTLKAEFDRRKAYSITPQQVGTWIDGTPIWRAAISRSLTSQEKSGGYLSISDDVPVASTGSTPGVMINSYLVATYSDGSLGEGVVLRETEPFYFTYGSSLSDYDIVRGWVEFATAADNIITEG